VRYAGDEFIVVLSGCGREEAEGKRVELQRAVDNVELEVRPDLRIPMLISAGTAVFPHDGDSYETLLAKADSRMYRDKSQRKAARAQLRSTEAGAEAPPVSRNRAAI
jgi:diguanylate cyclase (GGDEF)-like protein